MKNKLAILCLFAALSATVFGAPLFSLNTLPGAPGMTVYNYDTNSTNTGVAIGVHPLWEPNPADGSAKWISYADTGYMDGTFQPYKGTSPVMDVRFDFALASDGYMLLKVWADDTADVYLDKTLLKAAVFTQSTCSGQPIGCLPQDVGSFNTLVSMGQHTLTIRSYQVGTGTDTTSNPFGVLAIGAVNTPEPASVGLIGLGLIGLGMLRRWFC